MQAAIVLPQEQPARPVADDKDTDKGKIIQFRSSQASQSQVNQDLLSVAVEAWFKRTFVAIASERDKHYNYTADLAAALSMFCVYPARNPLMAAAGDFFVTGEYQPEECVAVYRLMNLEYSLNQTVSAKDAYKPHLEHGAYQLIGFEYKGFPVEMWRCRVCGWVTPGDGISDLNCSGCGEVLMPAEEELDDATFYQGR
jgi:rubrerythrin